MLVLLVAGMVRVVAYMTFGNLWRDEVNTFNIATSAHFADVLRRMEFDSYPVGYFVVLRSWVAAFGQDVAAVRALGLVLSLALLGALVLHARVLRYRVPLVSATLVGLSGGIAYWGETTRAWGQGMIAIVLFYTALTWAQEHPSIRRGLVAALAGVFAVQSLYYCAILMAALCTASIVDSALRRRPAAIVQTLVIGVASVLTYLPYAPQFAKTSEWNILLKYPIGPEWIWQCFTEALASPQGQYVWVWWALVAVAVALASAYVVLRSRGGAPGLCLRGARPDSLFHGLCVPLCPALYLGFLVMLGYHTEIWYYITLVVVVALSVESVILPVLTAPGNEKLLQCACASVLVFTAVMIQPLSNYCRRRLTTLDTVAGQLGRLAKGDDLIVVSEWEKGLSFERYYRGAAPWTTIPALADHTVHRYDLVKAEMRDPVSVRRVLERVRQTLTRGGTVYVVGSFIPVAETLQPPEWLPPPPLPTMKWNATVYANGWRRQLGWGLQHNGQYIGTYAAVSGADAAEYENPPVEVFRGHPGGDPAPRLLRDGGATP